LIFESLFETLPKHDRASLRDTSLPYNRSVHPLIGARQPYFEVYGWKVRARALMGRARCAGQAAMIER
jgi:hypothetical protein